MSRSELDREDLFAEAVALTDRVELRLPASGTMITAGFRRNDAATIYWDAEPVWHFNAAQEIRRGYAAGLLYKAERGRLVALERQRAEAATLLVRVELTEAEQLRLIDELRTRLFDLGAAIDAGQGDVLRELPGNGAVVARLLTWLASLPDVLTVAASPHVE